MPKVFINGPPGAGKSTLCKLLSTELGLEHLSTGDLLKDNIAQRTELGRIAKQCIVNKQLVPDHVVVDMVAERVLECSLRDQGWVLDGFPRTVEQSAALRRKMISPVVVLILELSERECTKHITGRRFDAATGSIYHLPNLAPQDTAVLARLTKRGDDTTDKLAPRFEAYRTFGEKTNAAYSSIAHRIDAAGKTPQELLEEVLTLLHAIRPGSRSNDNNNHSDGSLTIGGNQQHSQQFNSSNALLNNKRDIGSMQTLTKSLQRQHLVPQKIDEVDDEDDATSGDLHEHNDDNNNNDSNNNTTTARLASDAQLAIASPPPTSSKLRASSSSNNNEDEDESASSTPSPASELSKTPASPQPAPPGVDMTTFRDMLLDGFFVLKHGRRGKPHTRLIYTDLDFKRIFWQKPVSKDSKTKKAKLEQSLVLADVMQVVRGIKTDVLKRTGDVAKYERFLSLIADDRTLDMELSDDATCAFLVRGFDVLLHSTSG